MGYTDMKLDYLVLGQNIKAQRKKLGMKQRELAEQVHATAQYISHIETGQTQVSLARIDLYFKCIKGGS